MASSLSPSLARRERERLDPRPFTGHWTFLSSFPPLDVGQASGGRGEGGGGGRSPPARARPRLDLWRSNLLLGFQGSHHQQHRLLALEAAGGKRTYLRT